MCYTTRMRSRTSIHAVLVVATALAAGLVACAAPRAATVSLTSADVSPSPSIPASREPTPEATAPSAAAPAADLPAGQLACATKDEFGVRLELYLDGAKGTLRRVAPSGHAEARPLRIERHQGALIADDPNETDLASHVATLRQQGGKQYLRLGDPTQSWSPCE